MIKCKTINQKKIWEKFVLQRPEGNFLQSWNWGVMNKNLGFKIFRLGFFDQDKLLGVSLLIKKRARRATFLECPAGPLIDWHHPELFPVFTIWSPRSKT